jgi:hypothetical protein
MKLAIISDTHAYDVTPWMEAVYERYLAPADVLLHCGDFASMSVWAWLAQHPAFHAVAGNMDDYSLSQELDVRRSLRLSGVEITMVHGFGYGPRVGLSASLARAFDGQADLVCFGHTHQPEWARYGALRVVNPGSLREGGADPTLAYVTISPDGDLTHESVSVPGTVEAVLRGGA